MATLLGARGLDDLGQHSARGARVQESDPAAADAGPGLRVDQLDARRGDSLQACVDVVYGIGDVMEAGTLASEELADGGVRTQRPQQLDVTVPYIEQHRLDTLGLSRLAVRERHLEALLIEVDGGLEILDGDADVVNASEHRPASLRGRRRLVLDLRAFDPEDLDQSGDSDLKLLGGRLLGRDVTLDFTTRGVEGLGQRS